MNILISFSGGRTSAFMAYIMKEMYKQHNILFVYANTGKEKEETLQFIERCGVEFGIKIHWIEAVVNPKKGKGTEGILIDYKNASRKGEPFEAVISKYGLPSKLYRHCTRELKEVPINKFASEYFGSSDYVTALGIRADEKHRIGNDPKKIYPLNEMGISEEQVRRFWDMQSFDLELKDYEGNCDLCFLKSTRKKLTLVNEEPSIAKWWDEMEAKYTKDYQEVFDVYRDMSIPQLLEAAKKPFRKAIDKHELRKKQYSLFDADLDIEFDCFCKVN